MMKVLILGGSGILSSEVLKESLKRDYNITCITRGNRDDRIPSGVKLIHGDIHNLEELCLKLDNHYDAIVDFLSFRVEDIKYKLDYLSSYCTQYFFVSSATAYSFRDSVITENTPLGNEYWDYGDNKVRCENFLRKEAHRYGIKYTIIRPYITYGTTRIPFAIIPDGQYWSLAHRILNKKPILLWDDGRTLCTLTNTVDFAKGLVDLIMNEDAFNEAFHITSDEVMSWKEVLYCIGKALGVEPIVFSADTNDIIQLLPEYTGILNGDKAKNRIFDNSKIKKIAPSFRNFKPFSEGIAETIKNYQSNPKERTINYRWDGRIDWAISTLEKKKAIHMKYKLSYVSGDVDASIKNWLRYLLGRHPQLTNLLKKDNIKKEKDLKKKLHKIGTECSFGKVDFGLDGKMISIGNNVHISDEVKFINYRSSAQHFDKILGNGDKKELRDIGRIIIEDNVFISYGVCFLPDVVVGRNSLILENSVVSCSIPENSVVCGNPAKVVCSIDDWYKKLVETNEKYPWYGHGYTHDIVVLEREKFFFKE